VILGSRYNVVMTKLSCYDHSIMASGQHYNNTIPVLFSCSTVYIFKTKKLNFTIVLIFVIFLNLACIEFFHPKPEPHKIDAAPRVRSFLKRVLR
jgi:hypothetical protein